MKKVTITNTSNEEIQIQMYRRNFYANIPSGDTLVIRSSSDQETQFIQNICKTYGITPLIESIDIPVNPPVPVDPINPNTCAIINGQEVESISAFISESSDNVLDIKLVKDINDDLVINEGVTATINLNGHNITNVSSHTIYNRGSITIEGSGIVDSTIHAKASLYNDQTGSVVLNGGKFTRSEENGNNSSSNGGNSYYNLFNVGKMTINKGVLVHQSGKYSSLVENGWYDGNKNKSGELAIMIINGGDFSGGINTIKNDDYGKITINDGVFKNMSQCAIMNYNEADINGGDFSGGSYAILNGYINDTMDKGIINITEGTFQGNSDIIGKCSSATTIGTVNITGGKFGNDSIKEYCAEGYEVVSSSDNMYEVIKSVQTTEYSKDELLAMKKDEVQAVANELGVTVSGTKAQIVDQIVESYNKE